MTGIRAEKPALIRAIGAPGIALVAINSMIGAGIFALPATVAAQAGYFSPWLFLGIGTLFVTVVLSFAELSSYFRESGGPVLFAKTAFGPLAGFSCRKRRCRSGPVTHRIQPDRAGRRLVAC